MLNFLKLGLGMVVGYLVSGVLVHIFLTHRRGAKTSPAWLPVDMTVEDILMALAEMERTNPANVAPPATWEGYYTALADMLFCEPPSANDIRRAAGLEPLRDARPDFEWPIPHSRGGCHCGRCFCVGEPLPEEQTLIGVRIKICSVCAQMVTMGP